MKLEEKLTEIIGKKVQRQDYHVCQKRGFPLHNRFDFHTTSHCGFKKDVVLSIKRDFDIVGGLYLFDREGYTVLSNTQNIKEDVFHDEAMKMDTKYKKSKKLYI